jgi:hypothetical protein
MRVVKYKKSILLFTLLIVSLIYCAYWDYKNPFDNIKFVASYPGANDRFVEYTPVLRSNPDIVLGPTVGAFYADVRFQDWDGDGIHEAIIETNAPFTATAYTASRVILKYENSESGPPILKQLKRELIKHYYAEY